MISRRRLSTAFLAWTLGATGGVTAFGRARQDSDAGPGETGGGPFKPPLSIAIKNARKVRNGWGVNVSNHPDVAVHTAAALAFLGTRWVRLQFDGDTSSSIAALQVALSQCGAPDPDLKLQLLLNGYRDGADLNTWTAQQRWILDGVLPIRRADGRSVLGAIEGPNEINSANGGGGRGPDDGIDKSGDYNSTSDNPMADRNFVDWARRLAAFKHANARALEGVEILSPTILYFYPEAWSTSLDVSRYVNFGSFHYYAGLEGTGGVPSWPSNPDNFAAMYRYAQAGICPGKPMVQSEGGFSSEAGGGYAADGRSGARYQLMQLFDHHAMGGHRYMIYDLFNHPNSLSTRVSFEREENFGQYYGDEITPKPVAVALHNLSDLLSLGNSWADPRNLADTTAFVPAYVGRGLRVIGMRDAGSAGHALVMPKSDGTTMIAVWNEPVIDSGKGMSASSATNVVSVQFGSWHKYSVYDPTGGGGASEFTARPTTASIASGSGEAVELSLSGTPLLIELQR